MPAVHQIIPTFSARDAIGIHTRNARDVLRRAGFESEIYALNIDADATAFDPRPLGEFPSDQTGATLLYQFSTGSPASRWVRSRPEQLLVNYHNVTPGRYMWPWSPAVGLELDAGRVELHKLARRTGAAIAVSRFNERDLVHDGYERTTVVPPLIEYGTRVGAPDAATLTQLRSRAAGGGADWVFIGRLAPHKQQHALLKAFVLYRRTYDRHARLHIVGGTSLPSYQHALERLAAATGVTDAVNFAGSVPDPVAAAYLQAATVFVCLSAHEGFCVPVIEAMTAGVPVVTTGAGALAETVGRAGVVLADDDPAAAAAAVHLLLSDGGLRGQLVDVGRARAAELSLEHTSGAFLRAVTDYVDAA